jgi:predicted transcriptional regulator
MALEILSQAGLTPNEIKVYNALLSYDSTTAGNIIKRTGLFRPRVYESLDRLINKGLVSFVVKNGIKTFQASNPKRLADFVEEKENELKNFRERELAEIIKMLETKKKMPEVDVRLYSGFKGVKTALSDMLSELKDGGNYVAFAGGQFKSKMGIYYDQFQATKKRFHVHSRFLYDESMKNQRDILESTSGKWRFHEKEYHSPTDMFIRQRVSAAVLGLIPRPLGR